MHNGWQWCTLIVLWLEFLSASGFVMINDSRRMNAGMGRRRATIRSNWKLLVRDILWGIKRTYQYVTATRKRKVIAIVAGVPICFFTLLLTVVIIETPGRKTLATISNPVASEVYTADSVLIGRYFIQDRIQIQYADIPTHVIRALIATEDVRFFSHHGVDLRSLGRVFVKSLLLQDESAGGGSTMTQQLAKNLFPRKEYWVMSMLVNKLREAVIATRLESIYNKEEILALYLNTNPFGDNAYGIEVAAHRFFSKKAKALNIEEAAVLVGMLKATHNYNPRLFPKRALVRRNVVLSQMKKYNFLSVSQVDSLQKLPLKLRYQMEKRVTEIAPYFREYLKTILTKWCEDNRKADGSAYDLYADGLKIYTTIDSRLQVYAEKSMTKQMKVLQSQFFEHWGKTKPWKDNEDVVMDAVRRSARYKTLKHYGLSEKEILVEMNKPVRTRLFSWTGSKKATVSPIDSIRHHLAYLNAGLLAMDPGTGEIKAWVGGISFDFFQYDHVKESTKRQVGSIFKPIVYAMAIEEGISPCEFIPAGQQTYTDEEGKLWTPRNSQYDYKVKYSMRGALAYSVNTVSVKLINRAGIDNTIRLARNMGIRSEIPDVPSIALGSPSVSLIEMTAAYSCITNEGVAHSPFFISSIRDREGNVFDDFRPEASGQRALSEETAHVVRHMLQSVVQEGTASRLRWKYGVYNDVAAKTGTTQANADGWFMAMTPQLVIGTWVGADDPRIRFRDTQLGQGSNTALPIVAYFLKELNEDKAYRSVSNAKFPALNIASQRKLSCDLYELNDDLWAEIEKSVHVRDSVIQVDTLATPPPETFLQSLYKRKRRILLASQPGYDPDDATLNE
jgi:penicillin-binding protein 1A